MTPTPFDREHLLLPDRDGDVVRNEQEPPQTTLLTGCIQPFLPEIFPDGQYLIGQDLGIYWRRMKPPLSGFKSPDWYLVPDVPPTLDGEYRRSYVLWEEGMKPLLLAEFVSGDGSEEHDKTPETGKFWVYERGINATHYAILDSARGALEVYKLIGDRYQLMEPNAAGRYPIDRLRIELGLWRGCYQLIETHWLRFWNTATGLLLPSFEERTEFETKRLNAEAQRADHERQVRGSRLHSSVRKGMAGRPSLL